MCSGPSSPEGSSRRRLMGPDVPLHRAFLPHVEDRSTPHAAARRFFDRAPPIFVHFLNILRSVIYALPKCEVELNMRPEEGWVGIDEVAAHLRVARESIYRWVESKGFPAHRAGRLLRFRLSEVDKWMLCGGGDGERERKIVRTKASERNA